MKERIKAMFDYSQIAEKIYSRSFNAICIFILISAGLVYFDDSSNFIDLLKELFNLVKYVVSIYVWPVSIQIIGNQLPKIVELIEKVGHLIKEWKSSGQETKIEIPEQK